MKCMRFKPAALPLSGQLVAEPLYTGTAPLLSPHNKKHRRQFKSPTAHASQDWGVWTYLAGTSAVSHLVEKKTRLGTILSSPLIAMLVGAGGVHLGVLPVNAIAYDIIWKYLMPLATSCYLLQCDLRDLMQKSNIQAVVGFINGAIGTILGTLIAYTLVGKMMGGIEGSKVAAALCASYIGGSVNFVAVSQLLKLSSRPTMASAVTADNFAMLCYIGMLMYLSIRDTSGTEEQFKPKDKAGGESNGTVTDSGLAVTLAAAALSCFIGNHLAQRAGLTTGLLAFSALVAPCIASLVSFVLTQWGQHTNTRDTTKNIFPGASAVGGALMPLFFATIGVAVGGIDSLANSGWVLAFITIQLSIQLSFSLWTGRLMNIPLPIVLVTANANVGGPATAVAMCAAKGWSKLVQPAILTGTLGYAIANFIGYGIGLWLATWYT